MADDRFRQDISYREFVKKEPDTAGRIIPAVSGSPFQRFLFLIGSAMLSCRIFYVLAGFGEKFTRRLPLIPLPCVLPDEIQDHLNRIGMLTVLHCGDIGIPVVMKFLYGGEECVFCQIFFFDYLAVSLLFKRVRI